MAPVVRGRKGEFAKQLEQYRKNGFVRVRIDGEVYLLEELPENFRLAKQHKHTLEIVVDRISLREGIRSRLADSLETALQLADGLVLVVYQTDSEQEPQEKLFSQNFACPDCGISISEISPRLFSFNNPFGACDRCYGLGVEEEIDPELVIDDAQLSLNEGAITVAGWNFSDRHSWARGFIEALSKRYKFSLDTPFAELPQEIRQIILYGNGGEILSIDTTKSRYDRGKDYRSAWEGVVPSLQRRYQETGSDEMKEYYSKYLAVKTCPKCKGTRLKAEALAVTVNGLNIAELTALSIDKIKEFFADLKLDSYHQKIADPILREIKARLNFLLEVGLDYLTLHRTASTLSGGEAQRIRLATQIGSGLTGVLYILDEPSIGLHQRDNSRLLATLKRLRDLGNTVIVVEHDEETIWEADHVIDIGPAAGEHGGQVVASGRPDDVAQNQRSITGDYLSGRKRITVPIERRKPQGFLQVQGCREHNLRNIDVDIPLGIFTCVTGVSGSGKSSLVNSIVWPELMRQINHSQMPRADFDKLLGAKQLDKVIAIDQSPIGRTPRSNPATYTGVFDDIRALFAATPEAKMRGYQPGRFSFNVRGGRCEACKGDGVNKIEMHFLPDVYVTCEVCHGARYNHETLEVHYKDKTIADVLQMTVEEALVFFANVPRIARRLQTLADVGLGYIRLGQPSTQLSGGEAQRVKLATELAKRQTGSTFYVLDEPTTGLHTADVHRLIDILQRLVEAGNTVLVIEHNLDVIKTADYIIDLGPEGGSGGGTIVATGTPEEVAQVTASYTGKYLKYILNRAVTLAENEQQKG